MEIAPEGAQGKDLHSGKKVVKRLLFNGIQTQAGKPAPILTVKDPLPVQADPAFPIITFINKTGVGTKKALYCLLLLFNITCGFDHKSGINSCNKTAKVIITLAVLCNNLKLRYH